LTVGYFLRLYQILKGLLIFRPSNQIILNYYKQIDSFRFFAAFAVAVSHWLHFLPVVENLKLGYIGVDFFFVISGFLISYQLIDLNKAVVKGRVSRSKGLTNFIIRRGLRIFPLYYFVLLLATVFNDGAIREALIYNLSYTSNFYFIRVGHWDSIFSHFWSLSVEEHFYLCWPILLLFIRGNKIPFAIFSVALFSVLFRWYAYAQSYDYFWVHIHTLSCLDLFMCGAGLAYFLNTSKEQFLKFFQHKLIRLFILFGLAVSYILFMNLPSESLYVWVLFRTIFGLFCAGFIGMLVLGFEGNAKRIFEHPWLIKGGKISYAIYLLHNFVPGLLLGIKSYELPLAVNFLIYFLATILLSLLLNRIIEKPIRKLGQHFKIAF
jgi:peptidoglycan/LPS O-acetylase OafA/YrhL